MDVPRFKKDDKVKVVKVIRASDGVVDPIEYKFFVNKKGVVIYVHPVIRYGQLPFFNYNVQLDIGQIFSFIGEELETV